MFTKKYSNVKQQDYKDCGCACVATVCKHYGLNYPISKIREISGTDKNGTSALGIIKAAKELGFTSKGMQASKPEDLFSDIPLPAIAHVVIDKNYLHYMVIHEINDKEVLLADPSKGLIKYSIDEFFKVWSGVIITMTPSDNFSKGNYSTKGIKRFLPLVFSQKKLLIPVYILSIFITIFGISVAFYFQIIIDGIIPNALNSTLHIVSVGFIILVISKIISEFFRNKLFVHISQNIDISLMLGYYNHVIHLPMNFFDTRETGEIISRFSDASKIRDALSNIILTLMIDTIMVLIGGIILYSQSNYLFFITLIPLILYGVIVFSFKTRIEHNNRKAMEDNAELTSYLYETLSGSETIKTFNAQQSISKQATMKFNKYIKSLFNLTNNNIIQESLKGGVKGLFSIIIIWIGSTQVINENLSIGQLIAFNSLLLYFLNPIENIINLQPSIQSAFVATDRLVDVLDLSTEKRGANQISNISLAGDINIKSVNFRYGTRELILKDINMTIPKGSKIALVGESGSGKSTLVKLLLKFYHLENGEITLNNYNISNIDLYYLRSKISYVSQETFLFKGTIIENLTLGNANYTIESVIEACKNAEIHEYINSLPLQYQTLVEEKGANFSGGQRQRIAIARIFLKKPDILIFDEATSNLDAITERNIKKTIDQFSKNRTTIYIAHQLANIVNCDKIFLFSEGKIIEEGTHKDLLKNKNKYYNLWNE